MLVSSCGQHGQKATQRLYFLKQLKRAGLPSDHLFYYYSTVIPPVLEYCVPVWHCALTKAQTEQLESVQKKKTIHIVFTARPSVRPSVSFFDPSRSIAMATNFCWVYPPNLVSVTFGIWQWNRFSGRRQTN